VGESPVVSEGAREGGTGSSAENEEGAKERNRENEGVNGGCFPARNSFYDMQQCSNGGEVVRENTPSLKAVLGR